MRPIALVLLWLPWFGCGEVIRSSPATDAAPRDTPEGAAALWSVSPTVANTDDEIVLEGSFGPTVTVNFPGGATVAATVLGPQRARVLVPADATTGDLSITTLGQTIGSLAFRHAPFKVGLQPFTAHYPQTDAARQMPALATPRPGATATVVGGALYLIGGETPAGTVATVERARIDADGSLGRFVEVSALVSPRRGHTTTRIGDALFVVGGVNSTGEVSTVERAPILIDGSLGGFAVVPGVTLTTARSQHTATVIGAGLVIIGGATGAAEVATVERAEIAPDGSLGPFVSLPAALGTARAGHTAIAAGGFVHVIGGHDGTALASVERAAIGGDGSLLAFEPAPVALSMPRAFHTSVAIGNTLFVLGGSPDGGASASNTIEQSTIGAGGALGPFSAAPSTLTTPREGHAIAIVADTIHAIGGAGSVTVERASIVGDGAITTFAPVAAALVTPRCFAASVVIGSSIYVIGGYGADNGRLATVERAPISPDGTVGTFAIETGVVLATKRSAFTLAVIGDSLYALGGHTGLNTLSTVERATIRPDGSLTTFTTVAPMVRVRQEHTSAVLGRFVYVFTGEAPGVSNTIERAPILADGTLGPFETVPDTMTGRAFHTGAVLGSFVYAFGADVSTRDTFDRAAVAIDGALSGFALQTDRLASPRQSHANAVVGRFLYLLAGSNSGGLTSVERAEIAPGGALAPFADVPATSLTTARAAHTANVIGGHVYVIGGTTTFPDGIGVVGTIERASAR